MKFRELCTKEIVQLSNGACLGRADDLELDPATAQVKSLDAILVRTELPEPEAKKQGFWQNMRHWLDG